MTFLGCKSIKNGQLYHFLDVRKSWERQVSKKFYNKCSENPRSQIVFRTDILQKLTLGAPDWIINGYYLILLDCSQPVTNKGISNHPGEKAKKRFQRHFDSHFLYGITIQEVRKEISKQFEQLMPTKYC